MKKTKAKLCMVPLVHKAPADKLLKKGDQSKLTAHETSLHLFGKSHWRSSQYAVTHVRNKNSNIQERAPNVIKVISHSIRNYS